MKLSFILYTVMLASSAAANFLGTDEAAKYIAPDALFWARGINAAIGTIATGLKAFTSQVFADWMTAKKNGVKTGNTDFVEKHTGP